MDNKPSFYFYDLETTGLRAREDRVMQFAGQRTDMELNPTSEPDNFYIKITPDVLPSPDAVLVTGITPQKTLEEGISEADFLKLFYQNIATDQTIFTGFNTIRFDDEFMRFMNYRNFYDAYEWQWSNSRSKWDMLDVVRMTRALRPDGIEWPFASDGQPANKLELLTELNNLSHENAHDALSDVFATIAVARLIKTKQAKLFEYLLKMRDKAGVERLIRTGQPFVYTSGRYSAEYDKTTVACVVGSHPHQNGSFIVYDLRIDPTKYINMTAEQLAQAYQKRFKRDQPELPFKLLQTNKCPTVAPIGVLRAADKQRLKIDGNKINSHYETLVKAEDFPDKLSEALRLNDKSYQAQLVASESEVDTQLYDGFFNKADQNKMRLVRQSSIDQLVDLSLDFDDPRLSKLLTLYKSRQYPETLNDDEAATWQEYRKNKLIIGSNGASAAEKFFKRLEELAIIHATDSQKMYLLQELQLYAQSILPTDY